MAKLQPAPTRRPPSPLIGELREKLAKASKRASAAKAELTKSYSAPVVAGIQLGTAAGGAAAGAAFAMAGNGGVAKGIVAGVGVGFIALGAFVVPGAFGAGTAGIGGGMLAKVLGDLVEDALARGGP